MQTELEAPNPEKNFSSSLDHTMAQNVEPQVMENRDPYAYREFGRVVIDMVNRDPSDMNSFLKVWI